MIVDCHCHLDHPAFSHDLDEVIKRAKEAGIASIISNGINPETNRRTLEIAKKFPIVRPSLGIYPVEALKRETKEAETLSMPNVFDIDKEIEFIEKQKDIAGIGEVGLDYVSADEDGKKSQKELFSRMIALAERMKLPLIVHSRKAERDVIDMLETSSSRKIVLHCFSGKLRLARRAADNGWSFTIPTNVIRSQQMQILAERVPISQTLTETDAPYLGPRKEERNEPAFIKESIIKIAGIKGIDAEEMEKNIYMNYTRMF